MPSKPAEERGPTQYQASSQWSDHDLLGSARQFHPAFEHWKWTLGHNVHNWNDPLNCTSVRQPLFQCWHLPKSPDCCFIGNRAARAHPQFHGCASLVRVE